MHLQETITNEIINIVDGMFLLAQLHFESLTDKTSPKAIKYALNRLPKGTDALDIAYNEAMEIIRDQKSRFRDLAERILSRITYAQGPLTVCELQHALAVEPGEPELDEDNLSDIEELISVCAGLVTVDQKTNIVRLVYHTTQKYFECIHLKRFPDAQQNITSICLNYLLFDIFQEGLWSSDKMLEDRLQQHALLDYAARHWGNHARGDAEKAVEDLALELLIDDLKVSCIAQIMLTQNYSWPGYCENSAKRLCGVHLCAYFGLERIIVRLLEQKAVANSKDSRHRTSLSYAAEEGHEGVVKLLVDRDDFAADSKDTENRTPLTYAAEGGHQAVVNLLIDRNDVAADSMDSNGRTPLSYAAEEGDEVTVETLVYRDNVTADSKDKNDRTPLSYAAKEGDETVLQLLIESGAGAGSANSDGWTTLHAASLKGYEAIVKLLIENGADVEAGDKNGWTALHVATRNGHQAVLMLLLPYGTDTSLGDKHGRSPLHIAARFGQVELFDNLRQSDLDLTTVDKQGCTILHHAASSGSLRMLRHVINCAISIDLPDKAGWTPLHWAARSGDEGTVRLLLEIGVDANAQSLNGLNPRDISAYYRHVVLIDIFNEAVNLGCTSPESQKLSVPGLSQLLGVSQNTNPHLRMLPHEFELCDGCFHEIYLIRFMCLICDDFNYCDKCQYT